MKFQFKHQQFQADAARAVCEIFRGQQRHTANFFGGGLDNYQIGSNAPIELSDEQILSNLRGVQGYLDLPISQRLEGMNFSVEMETGVGKTYTYIKTMHELYRHYGWSKFIIVVPSVAIREGVKKSFDMTEEHFAEEYGRKIRHFVYNSKNLEAIRTFVNDSEIWAMIVNVQAFNARSKDARRMTQELDEFGSQIPMEVIAQTNPIIIIDEPQSVEGAVAKEKIPQFKPLMTLRYSATHRNLYNQVYRLDALDAYKMRLVKRIAVKGIEIHNDTSAGYIFFEAINLSGKDPTATLTFKRRGATDIKAITRKVSLGDNLYNLSNGLNEYANNFVVTEINGVENSIEFMNGLTLYAGQVVGDVTEEAFRRIQIRETIQSHLEREAQLFKRGIKVLSLFFIDEVAKYRQYDNQNDPTNGIYAKIFEEEYSAAVETFRANDDYKKYLQSIAAQDTHAGYFSVDKKNRSINSKDTDTDAYDLIMRDKERLLDLLTPVRFIFSHSALREGWDNPNVFQICALKQSSSEIRRRQEVGRGMRLCVNQNGERMDADKLYGALHDVNILTVIANESYSNFAAGLQQEIAEAVYRPSVVTPKLFIGKQIAGRVISEQQAQGILFDLFSQAYIDKKGNLTEKYFADVESGKVDFGAELEPAREALIKILSDVHEIKYKVENARADNVIAELDEQKFADKNFQELWARINRKGFYSVNFDSNALIERAASTLNQKLSDAVNYFVIESGTLNDEGTFDKEHSRTEVVELEADNSSIDLVGELIESTGLTRRDVVEILRRLEPRKFESDKFLATAAQIINDAIAAQVVDGISYTPLEERFDTKIFYAGAKGRLNVNAMKTTKNLYDHLIYDSNVERDFAKELEASDDVSIYVKLPRGFYIPTPAGRYNPDWAIVFRDKFLVIETKADTGANQLRGAEKIKIACARKYFNAIIGGGVKYDVVSSYRGLLAIVEG